MWPSGGKGVWAQCIVTIIIKKFHLSVSSYRPSVEQWMQQVDNKADDNQQQREEWQPNIYQLHDVRSYVWIINSFGRTVLHYF